MAHHDQDVMEEISADNRGNEQSAAQSAEPSTGQFPEQNEDGIDLSLIRENLKLTPAQRIQRHQRALKLMKEVRRAGAAAGLFDADKRP
ncbi:MAG TPA: hypothetical protein VFW40_05615 [Capsulimonadaceae bacterium]|nr:hypothetical protein [Capsulimonadaceae bacterium]